MSSIFRQQFQNSARTVTKFRVEAISTNSNAFGLKSVILTGQGAAIGEVWQVLANHLNVQRFRVGEVVSVPTVGGVVQWQVFNVECPRQFEKVAVPA